MKILVTGGAGFIGSNFIRYWLTKYPKDKILNIDKLTYAGHLSSLADISKSKNYSFLKADIGNEKATDFAMKNVDIVVHFAAESHVDRSIKDQKNFLKTNILGTQVLLNAALKNKIKRFHHVSTDEVFGSLPLNSKKKFYEETCYDPRSPYAASKASADHLVRSFSNTFGLPFTITNCSNNFGPFQHPEKFIPRIITNLIDKKEVPIYGDGKNVRDWLYVDDHVRAIDEILRRGKNGETFLVGGMRSDVSNLEIAKTIIRMFKRKNSLIKFVPDRLGHDKKYSVDWSYINKTLGWRPNADFESSLLKTVDWYKTNESWWRPLKARAEKFYSYKKN